MLSGAAVWPLLALLASGAHGRALDELANCLMVPFDDARALAIDLLHTWDLSEGLHAALGVWVDRRVGIEPSWSRALPPDVIGELTGDTTVDTAALNAWVVEHSLGILRDAPVQIDGMTRLVLMQAIAMRSVWTTPFRDVPITPDAGPWADRTLNGLMANLRDPDRVVVATTSVGPVTLLRSVCAGDFDVVLVRGEEHVSSGDLLGAAIAALEGQATTRPGSELRLGETAPGLRVVEAQTEEPEPTSIDVRTVRFEVAAQHDLFANGSLFGIATASDCTSGHFDGISRTPLCISAAAQSARAIFSATGFEAAAVTMLAIRLGRLPLTDAISLVIRVEFSTLR